MSSAWFCHQNEPPSISPAVSVPVATIVPALIASVNVATPELIISPPVVILTPDLAVIRPTESTFVTSS